MVVVSWLIFTFIATVLLAGVSFWENRGMLDFEKRFGHPPTDGRTAVCFESAPEWGQDYYPCTSSESLKQNVFSFTVGFVMLYIIYFIPSTLLFFAALSVFLLGKKLLKPKAAKAK